MTSFMTSLLHLILLVVFSLARLRLDVHKVVVKKGVVLFDLF